MKFSVFSKDEHVCSVQKQSYFAVCIVVALAVFSLELFSGIVFCFAHETVWRFCTCVMCLLCMDKSELYFFVLFFPIIYQTH